MALSLVLSPLRAQEVDVVLDDMTAAADAVDRLSADSLDVRDSVSVLHADSLNFVSDTLETVVEEAPVTTLPDNKAYIIAWCKRYPLGNLPTDAIWRAEADSHIHTPLYHSLDTMSFDPSLSNGQSDLRLPLFVDGVVPDRSSISIGGQAQRQMEKMGMVSIGEDNLYQRQSDFAALQQCAVFDYASNNLSSIKHFRPEHSDFQTERRRIERNEFTGEEQVETDMGLELESTGLRLEKVIFHADKWHRRGTTDLQISQTLLTDNWYKGGDDNMTIYNYDKLVFSRYDESMKTTLDITLELRLSGYYTQADTIHPMRVNDNQFRTDVSYGYKAWKNWYYSSTAYLKTPVFEYYNANSKQVKSTFLSPLEFNVAVGMDLKLNKNKNLNYSLMLAPLSYNLKCVSDDRVPVTAFGIEADKRSLNQVGASITSKLEWKISDAVNWVSRAYFFTSYHNTQLEFENTFNFILGRYSTAKLYLYPRFDDGVDSKIQMKEMLTFGLAFGW